METQIKSMYAEIDSIMDFILHEKSIEGEDYERFLIDCIHLFYRIKSGVVETRERFIIKAIRCFMLKLLKEFKFYRKNFDQSADAYDFDFDELLTIKALSFNFQALLT
jgi:hypothetical protein